MVSIRLSRSSNLTYLVPHKGDKWFLTDKTFQPRLSAQWAERVHLSPCRPHNEASTTDHSKSLSDRPPSPTSQISSYDSNWLKAIFLNIHFYPFWLANVNFSQKYRFRDQNNSSSDKSQHFNRDFFEMLWFCGREKKSEWVSLFLFLSLKVDESFVLSSTFPVDSLFVSSFFYYLLIAFFFVSERNTIKISLLNKLRWKSRENWKINQLVSSGTKNQPRTLLGSKRESLNYWLETERKKQSFTRLFIL